MSTLTLRLRNGGPLYLYRADKATAALPAVALTEPTPFVVPLANVPGTGTHLLAYNDTGRVAHLDGQLS
ncbi:hypothetical protein Q5H93_12735 [Hymenobacter sp. ASUV-10]|uniref:Uncharacterized protein n=1 Tax=Hymenobacter aranciens TaxID=3063996 RepID=A0ABT9BBF9_9BACT|nr:hypothetical protein [Hymenobacter sp. ASUV-10]MDO7875602.1 hypothetical protein [Hymenobacter sp. ASUV-10]